MTATSIQKIFAWEALDSRGKPTVACKISLSSGAVGQAIVPSGASTGTHEARELRDGGDRYHGNGVLQAVSNVNAAFAEAVIGLDATDQVAVDTVLRQEDGTENFERLGANGALAISIATAIAAADAMQEPLYRSQAETDASLTLPLPMVNILSGGAHAGHSIDVQDFLAVPLNATSFAEALELCSRVRRGTSDVLATRGIPVTLVADEGGMGPALPSNKSALEVLVAGIEHAGLVPGEDVGVAIDVAATQFLANDGNYVLGAEGCRRLSATELVEELAAWCDEYPIVSLEDPLGEDDWTGWHVADKKLGSQQLLGDDLFCTNSARLNHGIDNNIANAVLVKPNQIGTLTDARAVVRAAQAAQYRTVLSARSGETEDTWLADLAVGWGTGQIKVGSTMRSERTAKWNRLLKIEQELGTSATYAGAQAIEVVRDRQGAQKA